MAPPIVNHPPAAGANASGVNLVSGGASDAAKRVREGDLAALKEQVHSEAEAAALHAEQPPAAPPKPSDRPPSSAPIVDTFVRTSPEAEKGKGKEGSADSGNTDPTAVANNQGNDQPPAEAARRPVKAGAGEEAGNSGAGARDGQAADKRLASGNTPGRTAGDKPNPGTAPRPTPPSAPATPPPPAVAAKPLPPAAMPPKGGAKGEGRGEALATAKGAGTPQGTAAKGKGAGGTTGTTGTTEPGEAPVTGEPVVTGEPPAGNSPAAQKRGLSHAAEGTTLLTHDGTTQDTEPHYGTYVGCGKGLESMCKTGSVMTPQQQPANTGDAFVATTTPNPGTAGRGGNDSAGRDRGSRGNKADLKGLARIDDSGGTTVARCARRYVNLMG